MSWWRIQAGRGSGRGALPWLACALLAVVAVWQLVRLALLLLPSDPARAVPATRAPETVPIQATRSIASWHLFGQPPAGAIGAGGGHGAATLALFLRGTVADADPQAGVAVVAATAGAERAFRVGEEIAPGVRLLAVYPDRAVFSRDGVEETLRLPREALPQAAAGAAAGTPATPGRPAPSGTRPHSGQAAVATPAPPAVAQEVARARQNPGELLQRFRIEPVFSGASLDGVRVSAASAADGALLKLAGLQPGDVVTRIDGQPIDSLAAGQQALARLGHAASVRVTVKRNGRPLELAIDLR